MRRGKFGAIFVLVILLSLGVYAVVVPSPGHSSENVLIQIGEYSMTLQGAIDNNFLVGTCEIPIIDLTTSLIGSSHDMSEIFVSVEGIDTSLEDAISGDGLCSSVSGSYSSNIIYGQSGEEIGLEINGTEKTLQEAINDGDFCCEETEPDFYYDCYCLFITHSDAGRFYALEYNKTMENNQSLDPIVYEIWQWGEWGDVLFGSITLNPESPLENYYYHGISSYKDWTSSQSWDNYNACIAYRDSFSNCRIREETILYT